LNDIAFGHVWFDATMLLVDAVLEFVVFLTETFSNVCVCILPLILLPRINQHSIPIHHQTSTHFWGVL
jgi:hypothetical protein